MTTTTTTYLQALRVRVGAELEARMPGHLERLRWPADWLASDQRDRLRVLLRHAIERSPFHARRLGPIADPDHFELADLAHLPTMSKSDMMAAFDEVVSDRRLSLASIGQHIAESSTSHSCCSMNTYAWPRAAVRACAESSSSGSANSPTSPRRSCVPR